MRECDRLLRSGISFQISCKIRCPAFQGFTMTVFAKVVLFTDSDGRAKFREEPVALPGGNPQSMLSVLCPSGGYQ